MRYVEMVEVFSTYNPGDIAFVKSLLDGEGIHYYFQGENTAMLVAAGAYARLLVRADQAVRHAFGADHDQRLQVMRLRAQIFSL